MIEEIQEVIVIKKYKTSDGKIYTELKDAERNEGLLNGTVKVCNLCDGSGETPDAEWRYFYRCSKCNGSGYLKKKVVWE